MQDNRTEILKILDQIKPFDKKEGEDLKKIKGLVLKYPDIFERENTKAHITASAIVLNTKTKKVLLHNHKKLRRWLQFGGHADGNTDLATVALKEAKEESGLTDLKFALHKGKKEPFPIDIELQTIPEINEIAEHYHLDFRFLLLTNEEKTPTPDETESQELQFFSLKEIEGMNEKIDTALRRLIKKAELFF